MTARHEFKHGINFGEYQVLRSRLRALLPHDANVNGQGEYHIRSLYFDTPTDRALREKIDGVDNRTKFRIRFYNGDTSFMRLEKKAKRHGLCYKDSIPLTAGEAERILLGDVAFLKARGESLAMELYSQMTGSLLRPRTIVDYVREPFCYVPGNVRITLDRDIRTGLGRADFMNMQVPMLPAGDTAYLLEVKYDAFLPQVVEDLLQLGDRRASAFSKYAACRMYG